MKNSYQIAGITFEEDCKINPREGCPNFNNDNSNLLPIAFLILVIIGLTSYFLWRRKKKN